MTDLMDEDGLSEARREALICVSLGGVRGVKDGDDERWRISRARDVEPPTESDLTWLKERGLIKVTWKPDRSSPVQLTPKGVLALKAGMAH